MGGAFHEHPHHQDRPHAAKQLITAKAQVNTQNAFLGCETKWPVSPETLGNLGTWGFFFGVLVGFWLVFVGVFFVGVKYIYIIIWDVFFFAIFV